MQDTAVIRSPAPGWHWTSSGDATDGWRQSKYRESGWHSGVTPFHWGIAMQQAVLGNGSWNPSDTHSIRFRHRFELNSSDLERDTCHELTVRAPGDGLQVYLNGRQLELTQDAPQKKRSEFAAEVSSGLLQRGANVLAILVQPPAEFNALLLDVRLDRLAEESAEFVEKLVTERAVVCDQCSNLPGNRAACVYACPHDAALRVDAWAGLPEC
jgi:hypothetical protein